MREILKIAKANKFLIVMLPLFISCFNSDYEFSMITVFINELEEEVLIRDKNFSRGIVPFFLAPNDTFSLVHKIEWYGESGFAGPEEINASSIVYEAYIAGPDNDFKTLRSSKLVAPVPEDTNRSIEANTVFIDTFRIY
ncbi:MAG: hypothetical protein GX661_00835 [Acholeplasmataceae bacterium]|nr:hypothetical protein [Acholeplasmataceae bacterium]